MTDTQQQTQTQGYHIGAPVWVAFNLEDLKAWGVHEDVIAAIEQGTLQAPQRALSFTSEWDSWHLLCRVYQRITGSPPARVPWTLRRCDLVQLAEGVINLPHVRHIVSVAATG